MKLNLEFYSGKDLYCDGEIEKEILEYTEKHNESNFDNIFKNDIRWPIFYHLSPIRQNIINWYPFKKEGTVLEIGAGMGAITGTLCDKTSRVVCVELSKQRASSIANRNKDKENLEIIVGNLNDIKLEEKFDYITLIGVLEYAPLYTNSENPYVDFLNYIKTFLKKDGKLLIAIENQFGMKYFEGAPEDHTNAKYDGITGYADKNRVRTFGKNEIKELLNSVGFGFSKFYYPLPDYKLPNVIFSDDFLPTKESIEDYTPYYYEGTKIEFDEKKAYKEVIRNGIFDIFANSFFIETSQEQVNSHINLHDIKLVQISENSKKFYKKDYLKNLKCEELQNRNSELEILNTELINKIKIIENSRSWKITKPLRKINKALKKK